MPETEPRHHHCEPHRPDPLILTLGDLELLELILTADEFELIQRAEQGQLPCPDCEKPLGWVAMIAEEYEGLVYSSMTSALGPNRGHRVQNAGSTNPGCRSNGQGQVMAVFAQI